MTILAWHFMRADRRCRYGDGRKMRAGETLTVNVEPQCCKRGLHASSKIIDALLYAPGLHLARVRIGGKVDRQYDKIAGQSRECLWIEDVTRPVLLWCAETAWLSLPHGADERSRAACREVVRQVRYGLDFDRATAAANEANAATASTAARAAVYAAYAAAKADARVEVYAACTAYAAAEVAYAAAEAAVERARQSKRLRQLIGMLRRGEFDAEVARVDSAITDDSHCLMRS